MITAPKFTYDDVKFAAHGGIFSRALGLFAEGHVRDFRELSNGYKAIVQGTEPYRVSLSSKRVDYADCTCYMGQNDDLCKHMLALALYVLHEAGQVDAQGAPIGSAKLEPSDARDHITAALKKVRSYDGPSRIWFEYQHKLDIAAGMIQDAVPLLDPTLDNTKYLWKLVLKLSKKLSEGGVDDSNGTIGDAILFIIEHIVNIAHEDAASMKWARRHCVDDTGFGFEEELQQRLISG